MTEQLTDAQGEAIEWLLANGYGKKEKLVDKIKRARLVERTLFDGITLQQGDTFSVTTTITID